MVRNGVVQVVSMVGSGVLSLGVAGHGQELVRNINTIPVGGVTDSEPAEFTVAGGRLYFSATTSTTGRELFVIEAPGADPVLVADLNPGAGHSDPTELVELPGGLLAFVATTLVDDRALFVTDGTPAGTSQLWTGGGPEDVRALTAHQGEAYFFADDALGPRGLWKTDGSLAGTVKLEDLQDPTGVADENIASTDALLFFATSKFVGSARHWTLASTDGTPGNATQIVDVEGPIVGGVRELTGASDFVAWSAALTGIGRNLFVSDGTVAGTGMVPLGPVGWTSNPQEFTLLEDEIYFTASQPTDFFEVHKTDGTLGGTVQVTTVGLNAFPRELTPIGDRLFFSYGAGTTGDELWSTSGDFGAETLYADFNPGTFFGSHPEGMVGFAGGVMCSAVVDGVGRELFFSDGTPGNTGLVADIGLLAKSSDPRELVVFGSQVYFAADSELGDEPWATDGTAAGTSQVVDLATSGSDGSSSPSLITPLGDRFVFTANDGIHGDELWVSDGTEAGTELLVDLTAGGSTFAGWHEFIVLGGRAFFSHEDELGEELWVTDGTGAGTQRLVDLNPGPADADPRFLAVWRDELYFSADGGSAIGEELYATDGTAAGTRLVKDIDPGFGDDSFPYGAVVHGDALYFAASHELAGRELWTTDGTADGTRMVIDLAPGTTTGLIISSIGAPMLSLGEHLYFQGSAGDGDYELYRTDGTAAGTTLVADINPLGSSQPSHFTRAGERLVFRAFQDVEWNYFGSDGTTVEQLTFPPIEINGNWLLASLGDEALAMVRGANHSFELLATDGTAAGTHVLKQIHHDGSEFVNFRPWRVSSSPELLFPAGNDVVGSEMWVTDGTTAGTQPLFDLNPGPADSHPGGAVRMGEHVYFSASQGDTGWELFRAPLATFEGWVAEPFGVGCPGSSGLSPSLQASGSAALGETLVVELAQAPPAASLVHYASFSYGVWTYSGCELYIGAPLVLAGGATDGAGQSVLPLPIPTNPNLTGLSLWIQTLVADPGGSVNGVASLTNGLEIVLGS